MSSRYDFYSQWAPYVTVAQRRAQAKREIASMLEDGQEVEPVEIEGRKISRSFWGKGWCDHLESFGDFSNRLPRGRTYVRNGSVCHLSISKGKVEALVSGSELYNVTVEITPLQKKTWNNLKQRCTGKIGSLVELLQGKLSKEIMGIVASENDGLFPRRRQIDYECDCPDWAGMCKHIAAVMYGIGARLDAQPELLFLLRGVDHDELITADAASDAIAGTGSSRTRRRAMASSDLSAVFDVELDDSAIDAPKPPAASRKRRSSNKKAPRKSARQKPFKPSSQSITALRKRHGMTRAEFANVLGVSVPTVAKWENSDGPVSLRENSLIGLELLHSTAT